MHHVTMYLCMVITMHHAPCTRLAHAAQVLCWSSLGLATMAGSAAKGSILSAAGVRALYVVCAATGAARLAGRSAYRARRAPRR